MKRPMVLFARIGWMHFYAGPNAGDEKPEGGGTYNEANVGLEVFNFKTLAGRLYGYVEANEGMNLRRIQRDCERRQLDGVLVVFFSKLPRRGQVVVGWYRNSSVFQVPQKDHNDEREGKSYNLSASPDNAVLLPLSNRVGNHALAIPRGKGSTGQSNVTYVLDKRGQPKDADWIQEAVDYIDSYQGDNLLTNPTADTLPVAEAELARAAGYQSNPEIRRAVEEWAMRKAERFYRRSLKSEFVKDVSGNSSWDLECTIGGKTVRVEVKGLQDAEGDRIILMGKEVEAASESGANMELFVVSSIRVKGESKPRASGGTCHRYQLWNPRDHDLRPTYYTCSLSKDLGSPAIVVD